MKINSPALNAVGGLVATVATRAWMSGMDCKVAYYDRSSDPAFPECRGQKIYLFWHEYIMLPFYMRGHCNLAMLLSRHRDAEILSHAARHIGFETVRGSTNRGGVAAIRRLLDRSRRTHLTITPDGPRGPRHSMNPGLAWLARATGYAVVPCGYVADPAWHSSSWDRFTIPKPGARLAFVYGEPVRVPEGADEQQQRRATELIRERMLAAETRGFELLGVERDW